MNNVANIPRWVSIAIVVAFNIIMVAAIPVMMHATDSRLSECVAPLAHPSPPDGVGNSREDVRFSECQSDWESGTARAYLMLPVAVLVDLALVAVLLVRKHFRPRRASGLA
jgi:hypothetical protein